MATTPKPAAIGPRRTISLAKPAAAITAAATARAAEHLTISVPLVGNRHLPRADNIAYYAGVATLVALGILEWPAALVLGVGHVLLTQQHNRAVQQFGEALEER